MLKKISKLFYFYVLLFNLQRLSFVIRLGWRMNMKKSFKILFCLMLSFVMISNVQAETIDHFNSKIDNEVTMDDKVNGSTALVGTNTEMKGSADGVSFMLGNQVIFNGDTEYAVFAGNSIEVSGIISKDTFIAGNLITINKDAELQRDAVIAGADVEIHGTISRNVSIYASSVSFKGAKIEGNVKIYASNIEADKDTEINGNLSYPSDAKVNISKGVVNGKTTKTDAIQQDNNSFVTTMMGKFWSFMSLMLVFAVLSLVASKIFTRMQKEYDKFDFNKGLETFTKGLLFLILMPIIIFVLFLMSIGIPLALIFLALYFIIMYLSTIFTGYLIGYKLWQRFFNNDINMLVVGIFGLSILFVLNLIPGISFIVSLLTMFIGIGIIYDVILKKIGSNE